MTVEIKEDRTFTVQDPRVFEGDPYQVAERAVRQLSALLALTQELMEPTRLMVRNADLERSLAAGIPLEEIAPGWPESPQGRILAQMDEELAATQKRLAMLARAAAYNPKAR